MSPDNQPLDNEKLYKVVNLLEQAVKEIIEERETHTPQTHNAAAPRHQGAAIPSHRLFEARKTLLAAMGTLTELVHDPAIRLLELSSQYNESRCLHIAAGLRFADIFAAVEGGLGVEVLSGKVGIEERKLARILRCLASNHIFQESAPGVFDNNRISASLVNDEPLRAYIMLFGLDLYSASDALPKSLVDDGKGHSYDVAQTAWQDAVGTTKPRWEWLEEHVPARELEKPSRGGYPGIFGPDLRDATEKGTGSSFVKRPEHAIFGQAMVGGGRVFGASHVYGECLHFPWQSLGKAKVVDVGGGEGGFCIELSRQYPDLKFVVQDRAPALERAKSVTWPRDNADALKAGRVTFQPHDFFNENPVVGADVYWLRYIIHDWSDEYCVQILSAIRKSMARTSRVLIAEQVMNTTLGCPEIKAAPQPLPANYGSFTRYSHQRDLTMMGIINGIERTPAEFKAIIERAGLNLSKIHKCRSQVSLIECVLPGVQRTGNNAWDEGALFNKRMMYYGFPHWGDQSALKQKRMAYYGQSSRRHDDRQLRDKRLSYYGWPKYPDESSLRHKRESYYGFRRPGVILESM